MVSSLEARSQTMLGCKQTELGVIPEDWGFQTIVKICQNILDYRGRTPRKLGMDWGGGEIPALSARNVKMGYIDFGEECYFGSEALYRRWMTNGDISKDDIVITMEAPLGNVALIPDERKYILSQRTVLLQLKQDHAYSRFIFQVMLSDRFQRLLSENATGSTAQGIQRKKFEKLGIVCPPLPEQRTIAAALGDVDALIGALGLLIAKKRDLKQAAMQQLLTGQTRLPGFHGEWKTVMVRDVITESFSGPSPTCLERNINGELEWGVLKTTAITKEHGWDWRRHKVLPLVFWDSRHIELRTGDVIVTKAGPRHRVGVAAWIDFVPKRVIPSGKMVALRPNSDRAVPLMLSAAISARDSQIFLDQRTTGMAESQVNFENEALLQAPIRIPRIEEQTAIAAVLSDMDAEIAALEARRDKTRLLKQGMMQELLTGRTRLV